MELWKPIKGYEGIYEVSNTAKIRSVEGKVTESKIGVKRSWKSKEIKTRFNKQGYKKVNLHKDNMYKTLSVHRLVAIAFLDNPENKEIVNHIDGDRTNNNVKNLEWIDATGNVNHAFDMGLMPTSKKTFLTNKLTGEVKEFRSMSKASLFLGLGINSLSRLFREGKTEYREWTIKRS